VRALACGTVDHRNAVRFGLTANATTEAACHLHQVGVLQRFVGPVSARHHMRNPPGSCPVRKYAFWTPGCSYKETPVNRSSASGPAMQQIACWKPVNWPLGARTLPRTLPAAPSYIRTSLKRQQKCK
jgi:hypothetical protein